MIEYTQIELRIMALFSAIGAAFSFLVGGVDKLITALLVFVVIDYVTGLIAAWKTATLDSKKGFEGIKRKVVMLLIVIMVCSLLAGMMGTTSLKHMIDQQTPILAAINPVNLISDALYSTYYFGVGERYWLDLALLGVFSIVVAVGAWLASRRKSYASL